MVPNCQCYPAVSRVIGDMVAAGAGISSLTTLGEIHTIISIMIIESVQLSSLPTFSPVLNIFTNLGQHHHHHRHSICSTIITATLTNRVHDDQ